jgi:hypothetical protein
LPCQPCYQGRGALLPHRFTLAVPCRLHDKDLGGLFSVALSVGSRPPGVTWHLIRRSPDFPPSSPYHCWRSKNSDCPADSHQHDKGTWAEVKWKRVCEGSALRRPVVGGVATGASATCCERVGLAARGARKLRGKSCRSARRQLLYEQINGAT